MSRNDTEHHIWKSDTSCSEINLIKIPVCALRTTTRNMITNLINTKQAVIRVTNVNNWDYRRLVSKIGLDYSGDLTQINEIDSILRIWERRPLREANLWKFQNILGLIGRWDVVGETNDLFYEDARTYLADQRTENIRYDAIVLCAEENRDFSRELVQQLERLNFKIYLQDDNASMDHRTILKQCDRLIIIVSPAFLESRAYKVFQMYSQSLQYGADKNKIIPILYESCQLPDSLRFYFVLSYIESSYADNKDKLKESLTSLTANKKDTRKIPAKSKKYFVTKFSMPRISNWTNWMRKLKKHKKCRGRVTEQFDSRAKVKKTDTIFNVGKLMREKMVL